MGEAEKGRPVSVIGGSNIDILAKPEGMFFPGTSNPGTILKNAGGVGGNIARFLSLLEVHTEFYTAVGDDREGSYIIDSLRESGVDTGGVFVTTEEKTGVYAALQDEKGTLIGAVSDMRATDLLLPDVLNSHRNKLLQSSMIVADTNIPKASLLWISTLCGENSIPLFIEPVSREKSRKILELPAAAQWISPSEEEFIELFHFPGEKPAGEEFDGEGLDGKKPLGEELETLLSAIEESPGKALHIPSSSALYPENILLTLGPRGVAHLTLEDKNSRQWRGKLYPPFTVDVLSDNGAGDAFFAGFISALQHGNSEEGSILYGLAAAAWVLQHPPEVFGGLDFSTLSGYIERYDAEY